MTVDPNSTSPDNLSSLIRDHVQAIKATYDGLSEQKDRDAFMMGLRSALHETVPSAMGPPCIEEDIVGCIGKTKLVKLTKIQAVVSETKEGDACGEVVAKLEFTNPGLSVKDRIARSMLEEAEREGTVKPGVNTIVDVTSGNTGIGWGVVGAAKGYDVVQVIPEPYSVERRALMMALGVTVKVSAKASSFKGAIKVHTEVMEELGPDKAWVPLQFGNYANIKAHFDHTGPEIWEQCGGKVDAIVAGYGTGGTLSGITKFLRSKNPNFRCYAVEAMENSQLNGDKPGPHGIQGISPPFVPKNLVIEDVDEVIRCSTKKAMETAWALAKSEGIAVGISAGANVWGACQVASRPEMKGKRIVTILPSAAERYLSTNLYKDLMEEAKNLPITNFDPNTQIPESMQNTMHTLESYKNAGTVFREGFRVV